MPYIPRSDRTLLNESIQELAEAISSPGELNYIICRLLTLACTKYGRPGYEEMSAWRGAVQDASDEFYRRVMAPYEDKKCAEKGDVFGPLVPVVGPTAFRMTATEVQASKAPTVPREGDDPDCRVCAMRRARKAAESDFKIGGTI